MQVKNIEGHFINEFEKKLSTLLYNDFKPDLGIVFCSVTQNINELQRIFRKNDIHLIGATTAGEIVDHSVSEKSIVGLFIKLNKEAYSIDFFANNETNLYNLGKKASLKVSGKFSDPGMIVLSGGLRADGEELVKGLISGNKNKRNLYGALAGDDLQMKNTYVFTENDLSNNAVGCLSFDSQKVKMEGTAISGWKSIGTEKFITKSRGNTVFTIDNKPALDVFLEYFNKPKERLAEADLVVNELAQYPLQVMRAGDYSVLRAPLIADVDKGALIFSGSVEEGAKIKFSVPPGFETIETTTTEISYLKKRFPEADAILLFSCKARHQALGPLVEDEIEGIQNLWNAPLIGFFSYGEIGSFGDHDCDFHNETVSLVALKEL